MQLSCQPLEKEIWFIDCYSVEKEMQMSGHFAVPTWSSWDLGLLLKSQDGMQRLARCFWQESIGQGTLRRENECKVGDYCCGIKVAPQSVDTL